MTKERYPHDQSSWFVMHRGTGQYRDYGFKSKTRALNDVSFLNAEERAKGGKGEFAVTPTKPRTPPELKVLKGGKS